VKAVPYHGDKALKDYPEIGQIVVRYFTYTPGP
jgi:hypothetical protein